MFLSIFEVFRIGIGPSSSHTMGPMVAARRFMAETVLPLGPDVVRLSVTLHGSLAFTGRGHHTDRAIMLGLLLQEPGTVEPDEVGHLLADLTARKSLNGGTNGSVRFDPGTDLVFDTRSALPLHPNGMTFRAMAAHGAVLAERQFYSLGGGFVLSAEEWDHRPSNSGGPVGVPYPFSTATEMLELGERSGLSIAEMKRANEQMASPGVDLDQAIDRIGSAMNDCIERGLRQTGTLPGSLRLERRAAKLAAALRADTMNAVQPHRVLEWLSVYAMSVNEENASGARVVTAPTNGAAGVVPAVLKYYRDHCHGASEQGVRDFLLTAAAIAGLVKTNASISGAEVGCQGEVGTAAAMAAAGLAAALGATNAQVENAAEIALEHHLGLTCDPVGGLVQIPCIERNALGAGKAVHAASLAMAGTGYHIVSLDACIETMRQTGADMNGRYKETALGGLAQNVTAC